MALLRFKPITLMTLVLALVVAGPAAAAVPDAPWAADGTARVTTTADGTSGDAVLDYEVAGDSGAWTMQATAASGGTRALTWHYQGYHAWYRVQVSIEKFVIRDGAEVVTETLEGKGP